MKHTVIWLLFFFVAVFQVNAQTQTKPSTQTKPAAQTKPSTQTKPAAPAGERGEFKVLIDKYYEAWSTMDPTKAEPMYAKEPNLVFYDLMPLEYRGWKSYKEGVQKVFANFSSLKLTPNKDLKFTKKGKIAWTTLTFHMSAMGKDGKPLEAEGRHTAIWEKGQGKWQIVHEHVSVPLPQGPPAP